MSTRAKIAVFVGAMITLFFLILAAARGELPWATHAMGLFIATVAATGLLWKCLEGTTVDRLVGFGFAFLAGILLIEQSWSVGLAFGGVVLAIVVKETIVLFVGPKDSGAASDDAA